ncbi:ABHD13 [Lepeophtheirus salmonis]|uniref:Protein ABHD13 n=1 Tax=Lepeophtheirus salmonis TaxID=72036 RepID=A0A7R8CP81_LEPSM|nr:protein ABHD13-like [Lepeophtheirus salmonis]CAB4061395.1 ABHD13 [Lepeophtheirus salmonis]CAF2883806.1 ABHD13 [Lepeophtheirus salmonis]
MGSTTKNNDTVLLLEEEQEGSSSSNNGHHHHHHHHHNNTSSSNNPPPNPDFALLDIAARILFKILKRSWPVSLSFVIIAFLLYWFLGGFTAFLLIFLAFTGLLLGLLYHAGDRLLYHPDQPPSSRVQIPSPASFGLSFENVYLKSTDSTKLHAFFVKQPQDSLGSVPTVLYLHGNAGNIGHRLLNVKGIIAYLKCNVLLLEYRGYGQSDGAPSEEGLYKDAQAALDYLKQRSDIHSSKIVIFGRSLGGAVAIDLSSRTENRDKVACVLIENTFTSVPDIARELFNFRVVQWIPSWFYKNQFLSRWKVRKMTTPALFLSGGADALIPSKMMKELFEACGSTVKRLAKFPNGTHNETWTCPQYYQTISYFFEEDVRINGNVGGRERPRTPTPLINGNMHLSVIY